MPELPDVETFNRYFKKTAMNRTIRKVQVDEKRVLKNTTPQGLGRAVKGRRFVSTRRRGKCLFAKLDDGTYVLFHFGMTGFVKYFKDPEQYSDHARVIFHYEDGSHLDFDNQRMFGYVRYVKDADDFIRERRLGPDPLSKDFDQEDFRKIMKKKRGAVKSALMNQKTLAGLGNVYSDEVLFQAGIDPRSDVKKLRRADLEKLYDSMEWVLKETIRARCDVEKTPEKFLLRRREDGAACSMCDGRIKKYKFQGQRGAYYCPNHQVKRK